MAETITREDVLLPQEFVGSKVRARVLEIVESLDDERLPFLETAFHEVLDAPDVMPYTSGYLEDDQVEDFVLGRAVGLALELQYAQELMDTVERNHGGNS